MSNLTTSFPTKLPIRVSAFARGLCLLDSRGGEDSKKRVGIRRIGVVVPRECDARRCSLSAITDAGDERGPRVAAKSKALEFTDPRGAALEQVGEIGTTATVTYLDIVPGPFRDCT